MQCQAKRKHTGEQCRRRAVVGQRVCTVHGGLTPAGVASVHFKHGRYSKYLPTRLLDKYKAVEHDPCLLELRQDIALLDVRIAQLLERLDSGESGSLWKQVQAALAAGTTAERLQHGAGLAVQLDHLRQVVARGAADSAAWDEILAALQQRRRLVESERRRLVEMQQMITHEQALVLIAQLTAIINRNVPDAVQRRAIAEELKQLVVRGAQAAPVGEGDNGAGSA